MNLRNKPQALQSVGRRTFLKTSAVGFSGLLFGLYVGCSPETSSNGETVFSPNVYLNINEQGDVSIIAHRSEMGQGVRTSLPMILADELEADWTRVSIVQAVGDEATYGNQNTDGSFTVRMFYEPMRKAGAAARMMLEQAAAKMWKANPSECKAENHRVIHQPSGKTAGFGELVAKAAKLDPPEEDSLQLKDKKDFKLIGKQVSIVDLHDITTGEAQFGLDVSLPGMKIAVIQRCPVAGGKVLSFNEAEISKMPGIQKTYIMDSPGFPPQLQNPLGGVVIVADNTWSALKAKEALQIEWDFGQNAAYNTAEFTNQMAKNAIKKGTIQREQGSVETAFGQAFQVVEATYRLPHQAHSTMEPPCAVASVENGRCEIWAPTQHPQWALGSVAAALEMEETDVQVNVTLLGGGFGRKSKPDFVVEAALIAKDCDYPIKLMWTREDDIQHDFYHALSVQHVRVALDAEKKVVGWNQRSIFPSIGGTSSADAKEPALFELCLGLLDLPLDIPSICLETHEAPAQVRIGWLRSVCNIQHAFAIGSMLDEVAAVRQMDPIENMLELLGPDRNIPFDELITDFPNYGEKVADYPTDTSRLRKVVELVAEKSQWGKKLPAGRAQGFCAHRSFLTYVACVVEVEVDRYGNIQIPEVHYAVDCGVAVSPERVRSQFEGGAVFGASIALKSAITLNEGRVEQSNFLDYQLARMSESPKEIFVHIVESEEKPTGVGEPPVPPFIPALANAIFAATGKRARELPIRLDQI